jgi:uncharacterized membrane protein
MANEGKKKKSHVGMGIVYGLLFGVVLGLVIFPDNFALGIGIGMSLGIIVGSIMDMNKKTRALNNRYYLYPDVILRYLSGYQ